MAIHIQICHVILPPFGSTRFVLTPLPIWGFRLIGAFHCDTADRNATQVNNVLTQVTSNKLNFIPAAKNTRPTVLSNMTAYIQSMGISISMNLQKLLLLKNVTLNIHTNQQHPVVRLSLSQPVCSYQITLIPLK